MKKSLISFPSIENFKSNCSAINRAAAFVGLDDDGVAIYNSSASKPTLTAIGTVKIHGTNAGICYNNEAGLWCQSRNRVLSLENDNARFAFYVEKNKEYFIDLLKRLAFDNNVDLDKSSIALFGEWAGPGIQQAVAVCQLPAPCLFVFAARVKATNDEYSWLNIAFVESNPELNLYNIQHFKDYILQIDYGNPQLVTNQLIALTEEVESLCPVAHKLGVDGIGEGIVWSVEYKNNTYLFKVKGEKHAGKSHVKTLKEVDLEKLELVERVAIEVTPNWRLEQALTELTSNEELNPKLIGPFITAVIADIVKEEMPTLLENNLSVKDLGKSISIRAKDYFFSIYNS